VVVVDDEVAGAVVDIEPVAGAVAEASAGGVVAVAEASAGGVVVVVVVVALSAGAVAAVSVAVVSAFFWQAERPATRTAATATEVRIRSFMVSSPGGLSPDETGLLHSFVCSRNRDHAFGVNFCRTNGGFRKSRLLVRSQGSSGLRVRLAASLTLKLRGRAPVGGV
jgi:hypothetical protein